ncbi:hypothetical protein BN1723_000762 [Verticillium longisporum]|uniref:Uncharacterized protein n=1 Tax=Verticillium longisporum TaxID=100787 RepID=A0A0G4N7L7_VERLO|nr:hypothetical protein BN1723_000762 [Verticillium longisporum]
MHCLGVQLYKMQTYKVQRSRSASPSSTRIVYPTTSPSSSQAAPYQPPAQSPQQTAFSYPPGGMRQRETRENSNFIRIAVMEMAMRKAAPDGPPSDGHATDASIANHCTAQRRQQSVAHRFRRVARLGYEARTRKARSERGSVTEGSRLGVPAIEAGLCDDAVQSEVAEEKSGKQSLGGVVGTVLPPRRRLPTPSSFDMAPQIGSARNSLTPSYGEYAVGPSSSSPAFSDVAERA